MKKDCKTCTVNSTNDTVETCTRPCYLRYQKHRKNRICDLENKLNKYKQALEEILQEINGCEDADCGQCKYYTVDDCRVRLFNDLRKIINEVLNG